MVVRTTPARKLAKTADTTIAVLSGLSSDIRSMSLLGPFSAIGVAMSRTMGLLGLVSAVLSIGFPRWARPRHDAIRPAGSGSSGQAFALAGRTPLAAPVPLGTAIERLVRYSPRGFVHRPGR